jgi:hypothetical protein
MSVDGIGKGGPRAPGEVAETTPSEARGIERPGRAFEVGQSAAAAPANQVGHSAPVGQSASAAPAKPVEGAASEALEQLHRGQIGLEAYLDARVSDAVKHLERRLSPEELDFVRASLKDQLRTDPALVELVRRVTGGAVLDPER